MPLDPKSAEIRIPQLGDIVRLTGGYDNPDRVLYGVVLHHHTDQGAQHVCPPAEASVVQLLCNEQSLPRFMELRKHSMRIVGHIRPTIYDELVHSMIEHRMGYPESPLMAHTRDQLQKLVDKELGQ